jgi:hypothetical protein
VFTFLFDAKNRVLLTRVTGIYSSEDIEAMSEATLRFVARQGAVRGVLDLSAVEAVAVSASRLAALAQRPSVLQDGERVYVTPQPEIYRLARHYADHQRMAGRGEPKVVTTLDAAYALLGLVDPQFEPVEESAAG